MLHRPYKDRNILSDAELSERIVVMGPFGAGGLREYHPDTIILYFLLNTKDKQRLCTAIKGQSREKAPIFALQRKGRLGTIDAFWRENLTQLLVGAIQFIPFADKLVITHMAVRSNWRKLGINSRLIDYLRQGYPGREVLYSNLSKMGQKFVNSYER